MTKEQFIKFKQDFKAVIEETKFHNKYRKKWWNLGFKSEEEFKQVYNLDKSKINELIKDVLIIKVIKDYFHDRIQGNSAITHWTYYCAKHQLDETERKEYITKQFDKLKKEKQNDWEFLYINNVIKKVERILSAYENL